ncbi:MAG: cytochrome c biogenesis protein CcdA [Anaerolineales bacterium]|uniref:cytochrome c biogenesis CcdA family protein n=1 Tax=Candidatus Villigracilis vicinus TaxID=3140679 RepID=UPI003134EA13|nr:cytochrome c biogenesis protein CcdA [Anaerolineales bacterium]
METILTSLSLGLLATTSPCVLPLYPGFLAYLSGGQEKLANKPARYLLGFFVLAGVLTMMLALGAIIALLSISIGQALAFVIPIADLIIIAFGVMLLFNINPFKKLPQIQAPLLSHPFANAFIYGLLYGPIALPCSGPLVVSIFALSLTVGDALGKLNVFLWFGLGFGMPLLLLSFISGAAQRWITRQFAMRARIINFISGLLLLGIGAYDLYINWSLIQAYF